MLTARSVLSIFSVAIMTLGADGVIGQSYPNKPVRIITAGPGQSADIVARLLAEGLAGPLGQPMIIDNRVSTVRAELVAKATPDGYTLLVAGSSTWITQLLQKTSYDVVKNFSPITLVETFPFVVVVHPTVPAKSVAELIALAKATPGELNYGSGGSGSGAHLGPELFKAMAGVNIVRVQYSSAGPALNAVLSGEVQLVFLPPGNVLPQVKSGKLRALAVTTAQPTALAPGLPTVAASGLPGFETVSATAMWAPANTPASIINQLNREAVRILNRAEVKARMLSNGSEAVGNSPAQAAATIESEMAKWGKLIKDAGITVE